MRKYSHNEVLLFGKNKGYTLAEIYQYQPEYLNWLIENVPDFYIEINEFEKLPKPTPFITTVQFSENQDFGVLPAGSNTIANLINSNSNIEIDFKFSEKIKEILEQKKNGSYQCPEWKRSEMGESEWNIFTPLPKKEDE